MNETSQAGATLSIEDILITLRKHLKVIIGSTLIVTLIAFIVTFFVMTPKYSATTQVLVSRKTDPQNQEVQLQQVQADVQIISTYKDIITSPTVLQDVSKKVGGDQTIDQLQKEISINNKQNSQVFSVKVETDNPTQAARIANTTANTFRHKIKNIMQVDNVSIVSKATVNRTPVSPRLPLNLVIGFVLGLLLGIIFSFLNEALDKTVKDENFFNEANLTSLGIVSEIPAADTKARPFKGHHHNGGSHIRRVTDKSADDLPSRSASLRRRVK